MTKKQTANVLLEQLKTPLQRKVLNAIGYGDDLPEMDVAIRDDLLSSGLIEVDGNSYRMPKSVHKAWFLAMAALPEVEDDHS